METQKEESCIEEKIAYLQIIQGTIDRMGSNTAVLKGFSAAVPRGNIRAGFYCRCIGYYYYDNAFSNYTFWVS